MTPYYERDGITIYCGDCRDILPTLEPVDLVLTDPPYGAETHEGARTKGPSGELTERLIDFAPMTAEDLRLIFSVMSLSGWLVSFIEWRHVAPLESCPPEGLRFVRFGIWVKPNGSPQLSGDRPSMGWEALAFLHSEGGRMEWNGGGRSSVFIEPKINGSHPAEKPLKLVRKLMTLFSKRDDLILDPFMGSGTTLRAAKDLGRRAIGIEIEERYCEIAVKRLSQEVLAL